MSRVLAISSQVVRGHIGLSAAVPALQALGHEVWPMPTILLSNHPGHRRAVGTRIGVDHLDRMLDALETNGWLGDIDAVLTGYLPSTEHVAFAVRAVARVRAVRPDCRVLCDPVLGDDPKGLYIEAAAAEAIRDVLAPLAGVLTPNRFELAWLTGTAIARLDDAVHATQALANAVVVVTSAARDDRHEVALAPASPPRGQAGCGTVEGGGGRGNLNCDGAGDLLTLLTVHGAAFVAATSWQPSVPHGAGDLFAGLMLGHMLNAKGEREAMARTVAGLVAAIDTSAGRDELALAAGMPAIAAAPPWPIRRLA